MIDAREKRIKKLEEERERINAAYEKEKKQYEDELKAIVWQGVKPHIITRQEALEFKKAMQNNTIIELLFKKTLLPEEIQEAIARKKREEKYSEKTKADI